MSRFPKWLPPILASALLAMSAVFAMDARHDSRQLTRELARLRAQESALEDERRALLLEYFTFADFAQVRAAAQSAGMRDPSPEDGTLVYLRDSSPRNSGARNSGEGGGGGGKKFKTDSSTPPPPPSPDSENGNGNRNGNGNGIGFGTVSGSDSGSDINPARP